jgi:hypothetical protein
MKSSCWTEFVFARDIAARMKAMSHHTYHFCTRAQKGNSTAVRLGSGHIHFNIQMGVQIISVSHNVQPPDLRTSLGGMYIFLR